MENENIENTIKKHQEQSVVQVSEQLSEDESIIVARERRVAEARKLTLFSDVFMTTALKDVAACQHVLRILTGIKTLIVKTVRTQYRISNITSHDAILDVLAENGKGHLMNIEIQRADTIDHARRTRFYGSMIDSEYLQKGKTYSEMPDVHILYISETDLWNAGRTTYLVKKFFEGTDVSYDDGLYIRYVNAAVDDGSDIARLMEYFKTTDPEDASQGDLSKRVHLLKCEKGGWDEMCEVSEKWYKEGEARGEMKAKRETAFELADMGLPVEKIAKAVKVNLETVKGWFSENPSIAK